MKNHQHHYQFLSNEGFELFCECQLISAKIYCPIQDFIQYSLKEIKEIKCLIKKIYSNLKSTKIQQTQKKLLNDIQSLIYDLKFLKKQILNSNISLNIKLMSYFKHFQVDYNNMFRIDSQFHHHIMNDLIKIMQSYLIKQSNIKVKRYFNNFKIIHIIQGNSRIKIKEIYQNQQYYFSVLLYQKYGFTQQIGKESIIDILQQELWQKIDSNLSTMWNQFKLTKQVNSNWLLENSTFDSLFCCKKEIIQKKILRSSIVEENYNGQNLLEFQLRDQNDLKKKKILLEVNDILCKQKYQTYLQDALIQIIDQRVNQNAYNHEELKCTELFQIDIHEQVHYDEQEQSNIGCQIYQVQIQNQSKNNQLQNQFIQPPQIHENQPNYQKYCYNFAHYWWGQLNLVYKKEQQDLQELKNLNDLIDFKNECLTQDFGD